MIYYLPISLILAIFGTFLINPIFVYNLIKKRIWNLTFVFWLKQLLAFIAVFALSTLFLYYVKTDAIKVSTLFVTLWIPAISQILLCNNVTDIFIHKEDDEENKDQDDDDDENEEDYDENYNSFINYYAVISVVLLVIPILIGCYQFIYNYNHSIESFSLVEGIEKIPNLEEAYLLDHIDLVEGSTISTPIYRNGSWIYPVINNDNKVSSSGYIVLKSGEYDITFVNSSMIYSPYTHNKNNITLYCRRILPTKVLFGEAVFEINPKDGNIYFAQFYGDYENCMRVGRRIEGCILVNASNGSYKVYNKSSIPDWVTGYSL